jgi:transcriptional regulator with PAS, ATPase and Fis domain
MIRLALEKNDGNFTAAAEELGVTRQTLYNKMKKADP